MNHVVSALEVRKNLGEILNRILYRGEEILVERKGKPVAKIVPVKKTVVKDVSQMKKINIQDADTIRKGWARYQDEIGHALEKLRKRPRHTWPKLLR